MCLAIPGKIVEMKDDDPIVRLGTVEFGGVFKEVNLSLVPDAEPGNYVIVHVGFALSVIDEAEAKRIFEDLDEIEKLESGEQTEP
ncbi:MAG: HypC/HybG/HupF family hydrogenase formation chaperone [bacterium]